jgi:hypothetical protein
MKICTVVVIFIAFCAKLSAQNSIGAPLTSGALGLSTTYQAALARADIAVAKSVLGSTRFKGEIGETVSERLLERTGQWIAMTPRLGAQGLDHIFVQLDENGLPHRLMVAETKFGASDLSVTKAGDIQMGSKWIGARLSALASRYRQVEADAKDGIPIAKTPVGLSERQVIRVPLTEEKSVEFWRQSSLDVWHYNGPPELVGKAANQLENFATLFQAAGEGRIDFSKQLIQVRVIQDDVKTTVLDASNVDGVAGDVSLLPVTGEFVLPVKGIEWASNAFRTNIATELKRQLPHLQNEEASNWAAEIQSTAENAEIAIRPVPFNGFAETQALHGAAFGVIVAVPLELASQFAYGGPIDWSRIAGIGLLAGGSTAAGSYAGSWTTYGLIKTEVGYTASARAAEILGIRSPVLFADATGVLAAGGIATSMFSYGGYWLGYYDLTTAHHSAIAGVVGSGAGVIVTSATMSLVSTFGTAGTGVAISSLSGAAETSASLAWVGGGTLASGGFGVAGGTVLISTGAGIIIVGVTGAVLYGFQLHDEYQDDLRIEKTIERLKQKPTFFLSDGNGIYLK